MMKTINILIITLTIILLNACALTKPSEKKETIKTEQVSVAFRNVQTSKALFYNADILFSAHDMAALPVIFYMSQIEKKGQNVFSKSVTLTNEFSSTLNNEIYLIPEKEQAFQADRILKIDALCIESVGGDVFASETLIRLFEPEKIAESLKQIDARGVMVLSGNFDPATLKINLSNKVTAFGLLNIVTAMQDSSWTLDSRQNWFKLNLMNAIKSEDFELDNEVTVQGHLYSKGTEHIFFARVQGVNQEDFDVVILLNHFPSQEKADEKLKSILKQLVQYHKGDILSQSIHF
jgi:hypothetical protein